MYHSTGLNYGHIGFSDLEGQYSLSFTGKAFQEILKCFHKAFPFLLHALLQNSLFSLIKAFKKCVFKKKTKTHHSFVLSQIIKYVMKKNIILGPK